MFTILASTFMTATRQDAAEARPVPEPRANPLARVWAGGLTLPQRKAR